MITPERKIDPYDKGYRILAARKRGEADPFFAKEVVADLRSVNGGDCGEAHDIAWRIENPEEDF